MTDEFDWDALEATAPELLPFLRACQEGRLVLPRCAHCDRHQWPPRPECRHCGGDEFIQAEVAGRATLFSWMTAFRAPLAELANEVPYTVGIVTLDLPEKLRMAGRVSMPSSQAALLAGLRLTVSFGRGLGGCPIAVWTPVPDVTESETP